MRNSLCRDGYGEVVSAGKEVFSGEGISTDRPETAYPPLPTASSFPEIKDRYREEGVPQLALDRKPFDRPYILDPAPGKGRRRYDFRGMKARGTYIAIEPPKQRATEGGDVGKESGHAQIPIMKKSGREVFKCKGRGIGVSVKDFWRWAMSDFVSNAPRGVLAEFIVACALGIKDGVRNPAS